MDDARFARFPHHSWLGYEFDAPHDTGMCCWNLNGCAHSLHMVFSGPQRVRWIARGKETDYTVTRGSFHYLPADDDRHTIVATPDGAIRSFTVFVPRKHIAEVAAADEVEDRVELHRLLLHDDLVLQACMKRLAMSTSADNAAMDGEKDEAARTPVLRLIHASGGGTPDWTRDESTFTPPTMRYLIGHLDAHLRVAPSISDMAMLVGLSPSHFAKKFRQSTGLSLHRFINRRRLKRSLDLMKTSSQSLSSVSLELGFSSQSHFTRLFSDLTGMTPARYQKQFRRTVG